MASNMTQNDTISPPGEGVVVPRDIQVGVTVVAVTTFILAGIGNSLVIYIVCTVNQMKSSTNTLIANMAVADLLMTIDIPYILKWVYVWNGWFGTFMGTALCKFFHSAQVGSLAASVFSLVAISLDRSFGILFPMRTIMTRNVVRFAIAAIWLGALALSIPIMLVVKNTKDEGTGNMICDENWPPISHKTYAWFLFTTSYIIPILIIAVVYFLAGMRLWSRKLPGHRTLMSHKKAQASSRRATVMLITVVIVFALSWFPFQALEIIRYINPEILTNFTVPMAVWYVIPWFGYCNSAVNPIIYVIFSENYRHEFYRILCRGPSRKERYRKTIVYSRSATRTTRLSRASSLAVSIPLQKLREEADHRRGSSETPWVQSKLLKNQAFAKSSPELGKKRHQNYSNISQPLCSFLLHLSFSKLCAWCNFQEEFPNQKKLWPLSDCFHFPVGFRSFSSSFQISLTESAKLDIFKEHVLHQPFTSFNFTIVLIFSSCNLLRWEWQGFFQLEPVLVIENSSDISLWYYCGNWIWQMFCSTLPYHNIVPEVLLRVWPTSADVYWNHLLLLPQLPTSNELPLNVKLFRR